VRRWVLASLAVAAACNVPEPGRGSGGIRPPPLDPLHPSCGRGIAVVNTDYLSTSVSLLDREGEVLSGSFISSASAPTGLSAPLSGDVVLPTETAGGDDLVLIDRYPAGVLSWVDLRTARVRAQLSVATGFASNPHDYVTVGANEAWVTRFQGNDLLLLDPAAPAILGQVDLGAAMAGEAAGFRPAPDHGIRVGSDLYVLLEGYRADYTESVESRIARMDVGARAVASVRVLSQLHGCGGLAVSPDQTRVAVFCSGEFQGTSNPSIDTSGVVVLRLGVELGETQRFSAQALGGQPVAFSGAFVDEERMLLVTQGRYADPTRPAEPDRLLDLDLTSGAYRVLLVSDTEPFTLGAVRCPGDCGRCFVADARRRGVHRFHLESAELVHDGLITTDDQTGLPPRGLGVY
jgi:hypothetical protein